MVSFPEKSEHILGVIYGQSGALADGTRRTKMEQGGDKIRVHDDAPFFNAQVVVKCTDIGRLLLQEFYVGDAKQGAKFFTWDYLPQHDGAALMQFLAPIREVQLKVGGAGLWELSLSLAIRNLPKSPDAALLADVVTHADSVNGLYVQTRVIGDFTLQPQLDAWVELTRIATYAGNMDELDEQNRLLDNLTLRPKLNAWAALGAE
ncbi:MAG: hypothetical protein OCD03_02875 [Hyphomicrobiales bacterium]